MTASEPAVWPLGTNLNWFFIKIEHFSLTKWMWSAKWQPFCLNLNKLMLNTTWYKCQEFLTGCLLNYIGFSNTVCFVINFSLRWVLTALILWINPSMDHFVYATSQWKMTLQCNVFSHWLGAYTDPALQMWRQEYSASTTSIPRLQMSWLLLSLGHQQQWHWLCRINRSLSSMRKVFNFLCHLNVKKR